jgi:hypothetical protein
MAPIRSLVLLGAFALAAASVQQAQPQPSGPPAAGGGCQDACAHYLQCRGVADGNLLASCTQECQQGNPDPNTLVQYTQLDCATAIQLVEGSGGPGGGQPGGAPAGGCNADCTGCVWDGSSCYQRAMAAMGSVIECAACCCAPGGPAPRWD